jgi:hypothetical protein
MDWDLGAVESGNAREESDKSDEDGEQDENEQDDWQDEWQDTDGDGETDGDENKISLPSSYLPPLAALSPRDPRNCTRVEAEL